MEAEQTQSFNQKLSQWIASQGFWFQLRHSMSGGGGWAMTLNHLLRLGFKVLIALLVAAGGFGIYLVKRVNSPAFIESLDASLAEGLGATEAKIVDFTRVQGEVHIRRLGADGGDKTYFRSLDAGNLRLKMGLLDGMSGKWDAGTLVGKWMEIDLKAGANTPEEAKALGESLFREWPGFTFSSLQIDEATLRWGFSQRTAGRIDKSSMTATRSTNGWALGFKGGTFSQNWLKKLEIVHLEVEITPDGLKVKKGEFKCGEGEVVFKDVAATGGDKPEVRGTVELTKVDLSLLLPDAVKPIVEGVISGTFAMSGSTNSPAGIGLEGDVTLGSGNMISLREEKLHLLNALSVVDVYNSYRKVDLNRGSFHLKTGGGAMELSRVDVKAGDLMTLQGRLQVRYPKDSEVAGPGGVNVPTPLAPVFDPNLGAGQGAKSGDITLAKAAKAGETAETKGMEIFDRRAQERIEEQLLQEDMARRAQVLRCEGGMRMTIPGDAFDRSEVLRENHPVDPDSGRIAIDVPLQGTLFEVTRRQAEELLELGTRVKD